MERETLHYSFPATSIKIRKREPKNSQDIRELPNRSQRFKPEKPDPFIDEPWRDYQIIDQAYKEAGEDYKYHPIKGANTIRLVELLPGGASEIIRINLLTAELDSDVEYDALSYEWGLSAKSSSSVGVFNISVDMTYFRHILCHGKQMGIMNSLHAVLLSLRHESRNLVLWTDAICINQEDEEEKPQQLMLMGKIYSQAKTVLCWIGEEKQQTQNAFRIISSIAEAFHLKIPGTRESFVESGKPFPEIILDEDLVDEIQGDGWLAVVDVFTRPYFGRIWVVQEIVLSRDAVIICGPNRIPWRDFLNVSKVIASLGTLTFRRVEDLTETLERGPEEPDYIRHVKVKDIVDQTDEDHFKFANKWHRVIGIGDLQDAQTSDCRSLALCLEQLLGHEVTNPLDRVYGMLGMIKPTSEYAHNRPIVPSYKKTIQKVYREATKWAVRDLESLKILDLCETPATNITPNLPTWVPDLSKGPAQCRSQEDRTAYPSRLSMFSSRFSVSFQRNTMAVRAHIVDTVVVARPSFTFGLKPILMMQHFKEYANRIIDQRDPLHPTGCTKLQAFWRTIIANTVLDTVEGKSRSVNPPSDFGKHFMKYNAREFISNWGLPYKLTGQERDLWDLRLDKAPFPLEEMFPEDVQNNISILALMAKQPFVRWMYECLGEGDEKVWGAQVNQRYWLCDGDYGRQFFFTQKGWLGIGHPCRVVKVGNGNVSVAEGAGVRAGDVVAVLAGSEMVWVLRRNEMAGYGIVGQAYVYGLSEGVGFDQKKLPKLETIRIQ
ncbi:hypothetical protein IFR05_001132 [Cadophora sp. M221]|nr:hypothetical protein IFR05_001132 [Cadophora sp. M221]